MVRMASPKTPSPRGNPAPRRATSQIFRRPSLDQVQFCQPSPASPSRRVTEGPPRPASAFSRTDEPATLFDILEGTVEVDTPKQSAFASFMRRNHNREASILGCPGQSGSSPEQDDMPAAPVPMRKSSLPDNTPGTVIRNTSTENSSSESRAVAGDLDGAGGTITIRGKSTSPIRIVSDPSLSRFCTSERPLPRTFERSVIPMHIVEQPELKEYGITLALKLSSPIFVGGATIEGHIRVTIDTVRHWIRPAILSYASTISNVSLETLTVDVLGVESCRNKKHVFRSLAMELINELRPPPKTMLSNSKSAQGAYWNLAPSTTEMPFCLSLPVRMGPAPYRSKPAKIQYLVAVTASIKIDDRACHVRASREVDILTVNDPETTIVNLPKPLIATDLVQFTQYKMTQKLLLKAGVHRRTWVSGSPLYVDVFISNETSKHIKKIELSLEKVVQFFSHQPVTTDVRAGEHLRMPEKTSKLVVARQITKASSRLGHRAWMGTPVQSEDESTCMLHIPSGLVTVDTGHYFSVRFFLAVTVSQSSRRASVQIPLTIIHPNSLDIIPNSIAQVSRAIENDRRKGKKASLAAPPSTLLFDSNSNRRVDHTVYSQATPYNIARRKSVDRLNLEGKGYAQQARKPTPVPQLSSVSAMQREQENKLSYTPLQLSFPDPPQYQSNFDFNSPIIPLRNGTKTTSRTSVELGMRTADLTRLTKELNSSPMFRQRRSEETRKHERRPSAAPGRARPRAASDLATRTTAPQMPKGTWIEDSDFKSLEGVASNRAQENILSIHQPQDSKANRGFDVHARDISSISSPNKDHEWEDLDSDETWDVGGGPGPDIGTDTSGRGSTSAYQQAPHRAVESDQIARGAPQLLQQNSSHNAMLRTHNDGSRTSSYSTNSIPRGLVPARTVSIVDINKRVPAALGPRYPIRRNTGSSRATHVRMKGRTGQRPPSQGSITHTPNNVSSSSATASEKGKRQLDNTGGSDRRSSDNDSKVEQPFMVTSQPRMLSNSKTLAKEADASGTNTDVPLKALPERTEAIQLTLNSVPNSATSREEVPMAKGTWNEAPTTEKQDDHSTISDTAPAFGMNTNPAASFGARIQQWRQLTTSHSSNSPETHVSPTDAFGNRRSAEDIVRSRTTSPDLQPLVGPLTQPGLGTYEATARAQATGEIKSGKRQQRRSSIYDTGYNTVSSSSSSNTSTPVQPTRPPPAHPNASMLSPIAEMLTPSTGGRIRSDTHVSLIEQRKQELNRRAASAGNDGRVGSTGASLSRKSSRGSDVRRVCENRVRRSSEGSRPSHELGTRDASRRERQRENDESARWKEERARKRRQEWLEGLGFEDGG